MPGMIFCCMYTSVQIAETFTCQELFWSKLEQNMKSRGWRTLSYETVLTKGHKAVSHVTTPIIKVQCLNG